MKQEVAEAVTFMEESRCPILGLVRGRLQTPDYPFVKD